MFTLVSRSGIIVLSLSVGACLSGTSDLQKQETQQANAEADSDATDGTRQGSSGALGSTVPPAETIVSANQTGLPALKLADRPIFADISAANEPGAGSTDPNALHTYGPPLASESLYATPGGQPTAADVNQGMGNSYIMSILSVLADRLPSTVREGIRFVEVAQDGSHTYLVRLFAPSVDDPNLLVETFVPTSDAFLRDSSGGRIGAQGNVLWPSLYEKALVKMNEVRVLDANIHGYEIMNYPYKSTAMSSW